MSGKGRGQGRGKRTGSRGASRGISQDRQLANQTNQSNVTGQDNSVTITDKTASPQEETPPLRSSQPSAPLRSSQPSGDGSIVFAPVHTSDLSSDPRTSQEQVVKASGVPLGEIPEQPEENVQQTPEDQVANKYLKIKRKLETGPTSGPTPEPTSGSIKQSNEVIGLGGGPPEKNKKNIQQEEEFKSGPPINSSKFDAFMEEVGKLSPDELQCKLTNSAQMAMGFKDLNIDADSNHLSKDSGKAEELSLTILDLQKEMDKLGVADCKYAKSFTVKPRQLKRIWDNHQKVKNTMKLYSAMNATEKLQFKGYFPLAKFEGASQQQYENLLQQKSQELKDTIEVIDDTTIFYAVNSRFLDLQQQSETQNRFFESISSYRYSQLSKHYYKRLVVSEDNEKAETQKKKMKALFNNCAQLFCVNCGQYGHQAGHCWFGYEIKSHLKQVEQREEYLVFAATQECMVKLKKFERKQELERQRLEDLQRQHQKEKDEFAANVFKQSSQKLTHAINTEKPVGYIPAQIDFEDNQMEQD